jgi:hypothetical protein
MVTQVDRTLAPGRWTLKEVFSKVKAGNWSN